MRTTRTVKPKNKARIQITDAQIDDAIATARQNDVRSPKVTKVTYHLRGDHVVLQLSNGVEVLIPRALLQGLEKAKPNELRQIEIEGAGTGLHWPVLGVDYYVPGLLDGVFGTRQWMSELGRKGGSVRSPAKAAASRRNGRRGGRPRKRTTKRAA